MFDRICAMIASVEAGAMPATLSRDELDDSIEAIGQLAMQDVPAAVRGGRIVVDIADACGTPAHQARSRRALSRAFAWESSYDKALATAQDAVRVAEAAELFEEAGRARLASMHALTEMGRLDDAASAGLAARRRFESMGLDAMAARADINLGVVYQHLDQPNQAVECLTRARTPLANEPAVLGHLENNLGESLLALDDVTGAEAAFLKAREAFEQAGASLTAAIAEGNLADLAARQGHLGDALRWFETARVRLKDTDASGHMARLLAERAEAIASVGLASSACAAFEEVLPILDEAGLQVEAARARRGLGRAALAAGDVSRASTMLAAAATAHADLGHQTLRAELDLDPARVASRQGRFGESRRLAHAAMAVLAGRPLREIECRIVLAESCMSSDVAQAACELDAAEVLARRFDVPPMLARILHLRGTMRASQGRLGLAFAALSEAIEQVERLRGTVQADRCRSGLGLTHRAMYEDALRVLLDHPRGSADVRAFEIADRMRSRVLLDQIQRGDLMAPTTPHHERASVDLALEARERLSVMYSRIADALDGADFNAESWRSDLQEAETALEQLEIGESSAAAVPLTRSLGLNVQDVQRQLGDTEALIQYSILDGEVFAFVVSGEGLRLVRRIGSTDQITSLMESLRFQIARAVGHRGVSHRRLSRLVEKTTCPLAALYDILIRPLGDEVAQAGRLIVVPQSVLHMVPFHALHDGIDWLVTRQETQYIPSTSLLIHLRSRSRTPARGGPLVVAGQSEGLPGIQREAAHTASMLGPGTTLLAGDDATVQAVQQAAPDASVLHLCGHGRFMAAHVGASGIRMADRWLSLHDVQSMKLSADLVILSSCESGPLRGGRGDEPTGLFHGFLSAGASGLLASMWRVSDATASFLLESFHAHAQNGVGGYVSALREAQMETLSSKPHPAHWASFVFAGVNS